MYVMKSPAYTQFKRYLHKRSRATWFNFLLIRFTFNSLSLKPDSPPLPFGIGGGGEEEKCLLK